VLLGKIASQVEPAVKVEGPTRRLEPVAEVGTINKRGARGEVEKNRRAADQRRGGGRKMLNCTIFSVIFQWFI